MIFINWLCCSHVISTVVPMFNLKGKRSISALKSKSGDSTSGLGPKDGFSLEAGGSVLGVTVSTCSDLTLMELGATGEKDIWMLSPSPLHVSPVFYLLDLIGAKQFCSQQGLPDPHILSVGVDKNDRHTPCLCSGHTPINYYAWRQVMVLSLLH